MDFFECTEDPQPLCCFVARPEEVDHVAFAAQAWRSFDDQWHMSPSQEAERHRKPSQAGADYENSHARCSRVECLRRTRARDDPAGIIVRGPTAMPPGWPREGPRRAARRER